jgi:cytochrome c oxidase subunit 2
MVKFSAAIAFMNKDAVTTGTMMKTDDKGTEKTTGTMKKDDTKKTDDGAMKASEQKSFAITAKQFSFDPATITVNKGDAVTLTIKSIDVTHGFSLPDFGVNETLTPGKTVTVKFTADKAGTFSYRCSVMCGAGHMDMKGTLIVK